MKHIIQTFIFSLLIIIYCGCTPDNFIFTEAGPVDMRSVQEIVLQSNHHFLLANGYAQIEFCPRLYTEDGFEVSENRINYEQIEYYTSSGEQLPRFYSTSDQSLAGKEISVRAKIKGLPVESASITFTVLPAATPEITEDIVIPVVFHLIQSKEDINEYGGEIPGERINQLLDKINNTFSGSVSRNPTGIDTRIRFRAALYDPDGEKLREPGINRIIAEKTGDAAKDKYATLIREQKALWPYGKYLNIWLISDRDNEYKEFGYTISALCIPRHCKPGTTSGEKPKGLTIGNVPANWNPAPQEVGLLYKLQSIYKVNRTFGLKSENELIYYIGSYFGLLPTWGEKEASKRDDYCDDTHNYYGSDTKGYLKNITPYKLVGDCFFLSENIMDDPVGVHRSISVEQADRIHKILKICPERSAAGNDFAFTGK